MRKISLHNIHNFIGEKNHRREFRKQLRLLILITLGFTIAFTWRQTIFDLSFNFIGFITKINDGSALSILASMLITIVSVGLIYTTSHFLKENREYLENLS